MASSPMLLQIFIYFLSTVSGLRLATACPKGFQEIGPSCFVMGTGEKRFQDATAACQQLGGFVAEPRSEELTTTLKSFNFNDFLWIGLRDNSQDRIFHWQSDNAKLSYTNWDLHQPNNYKDGQHCVLLTRKYKWNDSWCQMHRPFVCQAQKLKGYNQQCAQIKDCKGSLACIGQKCTCPANKRLVGQDRCEEKIGFNQQCAQTTDCKGSLSCIGQKCACPSNKRLDGQDRCVEKSGFNQQCAQTTDCKGSLSCIGQKCACPSNKRLVDQDRCEEKIGFNQQCAQTTDCKGSLSCIGQKCACPSNKRLDGQDRCEEIPNNCYHGNSTSYNGTVNRTKDGKLCQNWDSQTPHSHNFVVGQMFIDGFLPKNYCRNLLHENYEPWCYTTDPKTRWGYCDVTKCPDS